MTSTLVDLSQRAAVTEREIRQAAAHTFELRKAGDGSGLGMEGYASITEAPYTVTDWLGDYTEVIRSGAFAKTLQADVRLLLNHDGLPLARTKSGTLTLTEVGDPKKDPQGRGQTGLWTDVPDLGQTSIANDLRVAMERGDIDEMSFAFQVIRQEWSPDFTQRDILEVKLFDVSVVTYPANPATSAALRAFDMDRMSDDEARELMGRLQTRLAPQSDGRSLAAVRAQAAGLRLIP